MNEIEQVIKAMMNHAQELEERGERHVYVAATHALLLQKERIEGLETQLEKLKDHLKGIGK